jgi:hypothetical protein
MKRLWQNVQQEAPDELVGAECHCAVPRLPVAAVILVAEGHAARIESKEATVRDGDAMGVAGEIGEHRLRPGEGRLAVDEPFLALERCQMCGKDLAAMQVLALAKEREPACRVGVGERRQEQPPRSTTCSTLAREAGFLARRTGHASIKFRVLYQLIKA